VALEADVARHMVELAGKVDRRAQLEHHPVLLVKTSFASARYTIDRRQIKKMRSLTVAEMAVNTTSFPLFMKAWQRGMAELLASPLALRNAVATAQPLLAGLYQLEALVCGAGSTVLKDAARRHITAKLGDLDRICRSKAIVEVLRSIEAYFHSPLVVEGSATNKRKYLLYGATAVAVVTTMIMFAPVAFPSVALPGFFAGLAGVPSVGKAIVSATSLVGLYSSLKKGSETSTELMNINVLRMLVDSLRTPDTDDEVALSSSFVEKDSMMLELVLKEKLQELGMLGKSVEELLRAEVIEVQADGSTFSITKESMRSIAVRMQASVTLLSIREGLARQYFLGIVGPQNSGKSTLTSLLLRGAAHIETGDDVHTEHAFLYPATPRFKIVDFAGMTATSDEVANVANRCGFMASAFVYVTHFLGDPGRVDMNLLRRLLPFDCRILFCLNQCSRREDSLQSAGQVEMYKRRWETFIQAQLEQLEEEGMCYEDGGDETAEERAARAGEGDVVGTEVAILQAARSPALKGKGRLRVDVLLTDFTNCTPHLRSVGVHDISSVREWIGSHVSQLDLLDGEVQAFLDGPKASL